jgi:hypothetical protein
VQYISKKKNAAADKLLHKFSDFLNLAEEDDENIIKDFINSELNFI